MINVQLMDVMTDTCGAPLMLILIRIKDMVSVHGSLVPLVAVMQVANPVSFHLFSLVTLIMDALLRAERTICSGAPPQLIMIKTKNMVFAKVRDSWSMFRLLKETVQTGNQSMNLCRVRIFIVSCCCARSWSRNWP